MNMLTKIAVAAALTAGAAQAATVFTNADNTTINGGNYGGFTFKLDDAWPSITGDVTPLMELNAVTVYSRGNDDSRETNLAAFLNVYDGATFIGTSTNSFNWSTIDTEGATGEYTFASGLVLDSSKLYTFRFSSTTSDGSLDIAARVQVTQPNALEGTMLNTAGAPADTGFDPRLTVTAQAVPEPSSAALLGLGGLALILRRRK